MLLNLGVILLLSLGVIHYDRHIVIVVIIINPHTSARPLGPAVSPPSLGLFSAPERAAAAAAPPVAPAHWLPQRRQRHPQRQPQQWLPQRRRR
jgi:hypothetical protein